MPFTNISSLRQLNAAGILANGELSYRQNMKSRKIAFVVIGNQQWPTLSLHVEKVVAAENAATPGSFAEVETPLTPKKQFTRT